MIAPPTFDLVRAGVARVACWLLLLGLTLLCVPAAFAGVGVETAILTGPDDVTTSTTADFTFWSNRPSAEYWCKLDDAPDFVPCDGDTWHLEDLTPGPHTIWVYAYVPRTTEMDESPASWEWTVEELPPPLDAGSPDGDGGVPGGDAGTGADGGPSGGDAGTGDTDGGTPAGDAGTNADGGSSGSDAGTGDGGPSGSDAGTGDSDAGTSGGMDGGTDPGGHGDGGTPAEDAGTTDADGGTGDDAGNPDPVPPDDTPTSDEALDYLGAGMGCTGAPAPGAVAGLLLLVLALHRRRGR